MASRPPRASKSDSPSKNSYNEQKQVPGEGLDAGSTIKDSSLQRREIPSYSDSREARIAEAAYWRAERRGFAPGAELEDWLAAEKDVDDQSSERSDNSQRQGDARERK